jgi:hypothetical protein
MRANEHTTAVTNYGNPNPFEFATWQEFTPLNVFKHANFRQVTRGELLSVFLGFL